MSPGQAPHSQARDWAPSADLAALRQRAALLAAIRVFFAARQVTEVDTPVLSAAAVTSPSLQSFVTRYHGATRQPLYLQTSPEFAMKRLLAAGSGSIYQIAKVFRDGEAGRLHNPEFSLLEWYRVGFDHHQLMDEVEALVGLLLPSVARLPSLRLSYSALFREYLTIDPLRVSTPELARRAARAGVNAPTGLSTAEQDRDAWLDLLLTHCIEPRLPAERQVFIYDYPASQAALARIRQNSDGSPPVAERFELYIDGVEIANGFHELSDPHEQLQRFEQENAARLGQDPAQPAMPIDQRLLAALEYLPDCAGVALGIDRLLMIAAGAASLAEVIAFPIDRA